MALGPGGGRGDDLPPRPRRAEADDRSAPLIWGHGGSKKVPAIFESARAVGDVCHVGLGLNLHSIVHVDDLGDVFVLAAKHGTPGAIYHAAMRFASRASTSCSTPAMRCSNRWLKCAPALAGSTPSAVPLSKMSRPPAMTMFINRNPARRAK